MTPGYVYLVQDGGVPGTLFNSAAAGGQFTVKCGDALGPTVYANVTMTP
jgi:hypothetical protein